MRSGRLFFLGLALTEANASTAMMTKVRLNQRLFRSIIINPFLMRAARGKRATPVHFGKFRLPAPRNPSDSKGVKESIAEGFHCQSLQPPAVAGG